MKARVALVAAALLASAFSLVPGHAAVGCAAAGSGGEWRSYGGELTGTRNQLDSTINAANVANVAKAWSFDAASLVDGHGNPINGGTFSNTPVVADGCVFLASSTGWVFALNADSGALVWKRLFQGRGQTLLGGIIVGSPAVANGKVYVGVSDPGTPYVSALDEFGNGDGTTTEQWRTVVEGDKSPAGCNGTDVPCDYNYTQANSLINASPVVTPEGLLFQGFAGNEGGSPARGGFAVLDAITGARLVHTYTISDAEYAAGYRGASVWCTGAYLQSTRHIYACGGNPASKPLEARYSNALLKIDLDPARATFGQVVDAFKGDTDQYYPGLDRQPVCDQFGGQLAVVWSQACLQLDLDFGSSPSLTQDSLGRPVVVDLQKSGVVHAVYADNMEQVWSTVVGAPCPACNASSGAIADGNYYTAATPGSVLYGISDGNHNAAGRYSWAYPTPDGTHFQSTSVSKGVVYSVDGAGFLNAVDAKSGVPLFKKSLSADVGTNAADASSQGVALARNAIFAASSSFVVAYK
jgi:outer membrane protein assembly factor BamB